MSQAHDHGPFYDILQLTNIAGPVVSHQPIDRLAADAFDPFSNPGRKLVHEKVDQQGNVIQPFAKRRQRQRKHIEPIIQILAEGSFANALEQITISRRDDPHVDLK